MCILVIRKEGWKEGRRRKKGRCLSIRMEISEWIGCWLGWKEYEVLLDVEEQTIGRRDETRQ